MLISITSLEANTQTVTWLHDWDAAIKEARKKNYPIFLDVYASWCEYCKILHNEIYPSTKINSELKKFITVSIDGEKSPEIMQKFDLKGFPSIILLDKNGYELEKINGVIKEEPLIKIIRKAYVNKDIEFLLLKDLKKDEASPIANFKIAIYYFELEQHQTARRYFLKVWEQKQHSDLHLRKDAIYNAALSSMKLNENSLAVKYWDLYLNEFKNLNSDDYVYARFYRGIAHKYSGNKRAAKIDLKYAEERLNNDIDKNTAREMISQL